MNLRHRIVASYSKAIRKKCVLNLLRNFDNDGEFLMSAGIVDSRRMERQTGKRATMTVFVRVTDNVPSPIDLNERPGTYLDIELAN